MRNFDVLFDRGEASAIEDPAYVRYGQLGFPARPQDSDRPWIYANFVQSLDGIASLRGKHASGGDISQSAEDRWLMDLLRSHADAVLLGINTLIEETVMRGGRGPVFRIMDPELRELRCKLGRCREKNIFVTGSGSVRLGDYRAFDGEHVDPVIITTTQGRDRLAEFSATHSHVSYVVAGQGRFVDLSEAMRVLRRDLGIHHLLCEGGPTLYGHMQRAGLIDEKFITVSPVEVGQIVPSEEESIGPAGMEGVLPLSLRPTTLSAPGFTKDNAPWFEWISCRRVGDHQFSRYRRRR